MSHRILFIGHVWPETRSSGAGVRTRAFIEQALEAGYEVHVAAPSKETVFTDELHQLGIRTHFVEANDPAFDPWIAELHPTIVVLDRFMIEEQFGWRIRELSPDTAIVLDTVDLHCLRRAREAQVRGGALLRSDSSSPTGTAPRNTPTPAPPEDAPLVNPVPLDLSGDDTSRELASILRSDLSIMISSVEMEMLREMGIPERKLLYLPYSYRPNVFERSVPFYGERNHFASIGNFRHPPNLDSVRLMMNSLWPRIRARLPNAELHLYGAYPPKEVMDRNGKIPGLKVMGPCEDAIATLMKYRVLLAPLRFGAGLKGKITDAWIAGTPVCTTSIGAEGLSPNFSFAGRVDDQVESWISSAVELHESPVLWNQIQEEGRAAARSLVNWQMNGRTFIQALQVLQADLPLRRKTDYLQSAFLQQSAAASKYLSKWIEAKNRKSDQTDQSEKPQQE